MPLLLRSLLSRPSPLRLGGILLSLWMGLAPVVGEAAPKTKSSKTKKGTRTRGGTSKTSPSKAAPSETPEPQPAPSTPPPESTPVAPEVVAPVTTPAPAPTPAPVMTPMPMPAPPTLRPAPVRAAPVVRPAEPAPPAPKEPSGRMRLGLSPDIFQESGRLNGELLINASRRDESFDYSSVSFLSATLWVDTSVPSVSERLRMGVGARLLGNYSAGGGRLFGFGLLNELFALAEYGLPVADRMEVVLGARAGLSVLVPGQDLAAEIRRYQEQGVHVWSVPRVGWLVGPSVGARRRMTEHIFLRLDVHAQVEAQYLFATSQEVNGLYFTKNWSSQALRLGLSLGAEFGL